MRPAAGCSRRSGGTKADSSSQGIGNLVHELAAEARNPAGSMRRALLALFEERWRTVDVPDGWWRRQATGACREMVRRLADYLAAQPGRFVATEQDFEMRLGPGACSPAGSTGWRSTMTAGRWWSTSRPARRKPSESRAGQSTRSSAPTRRRSRRARSTSSSRRTVLGRRRAACSSARRQREHPASRAGRCRPTTIPSWARRLVVETADGMAASTFQAVDNSLLRVLPGADVAARSPRGSAGVEPVTAAVSAVAAPRRCAAVHGSRHRRRRCSGSPADRRSRPRSSRRRWSRLLVVAGAGSGKTETMAARVVWLVANGYVRPEQMLGLTFTRKAAGELAHRIRPGSASSRAGGLGRRRAAARRRADRVHLPLVRRPGRHRARPAARLRAGARLLTEAVALADRRPAGAHLRRRHDRRRPARRPPCRRGAAICRRAGRAPRHRPTSWPRGPGGSSPRCRRCLRGARAGAATPGQDGAQPRSAPGCSCCRWCARSSRRKRAARRWTSATRWPCAAATGRDHPEVGAIERDRFRVVLLDEYQDTSHAQVVAAARAVRRRTPGHRGRRPVPVHLRLARRQRAAPSAPFAEHFPTSDGRPARQRSLTVSFRNGAAHPACRQLAVRRAAR